MKETIKYSIILGLICFFASGVLAVVNAVTEPKIKQQKEQAESVALREVLPEASFFEKRSPQESMSYYLAFDREDNLIGFVIKSSQRGYSSDIEVIASLNLDLEIVNVKILSQNETPGVGSRISDESFLNQFRGKDLNSMDEVDAITGATISSSAVIDSIKNKISELKDILLKELQNAG